VKIEGKASEIIEFLNYLISRHQISNSNYQPEPQLKLETQLEQTEMKTQLEQTKLKTEPKTKPRPPAKCEESAYMDSIKENVVISFIQEENTLVNKMRVRTLKSKYFFDFEYDAINRSYNYRHEEFAIKIADRTKSEPKSVHDYWVFSNHHDSCKYQSKEAKSIILECFDIAHRIARFSQEGIIPFTLNAIVENAINNVLIEVSYNSKGERFILAEIKGNLMKFKPENWPFKNKPVSLKESVEEINNGNG
jgi:hypothetical protein